MTFKVTFFGDSICVGQGVAIHDGWVTRISRDLANLGKRLGIPILTTNASVNGDTTRQALERMPYHVQSHGIDLLIVQFGMNDCNCWRSDRGLPRVSPEAFKANLEEIIDRGLMFGARQVVLHTNHTTTRTVENLPGRQETYQARNEAYNHIIRQVASTHPETILVDMEAAFLKAVQNGTAKVQDLVLEDGLHLSLQGHDLAYQIAAPVVLAQTERLLTS